MKNNTLIKFIKTLIGKYSNEEQSFLNPRIFAHINMFFQPLPWKAFEAPIIYSEQSYNYSPWSPYRQALHKVRLKGNLIIVDNYMIEEPIKVAGAGFMPELLETLQYSKLIKRAGCSMHFKEEDCNVFVGEVEPGNLCLIKHSGKITYLSSKVKLKQNSWTILDEGFDKTTNIKVWGSLYGPIKFRKINNLSSIMDEDYIKSISSHIDS